MATIEHLSHNPGSSISALDIDWSISNLYFKDIAANSTFTFSNIEDKSITVNLKNTSGSDIIVTFPTTIKIGYGDIILAGQDVSYTFTRIGADTIAQSVNATTLSYNVQYLVIAGGGGGGPAIGAGTFGSGGGGAGGYRTAAGFTLAPATSYTITVGAGGAVGVTGSDSVFDTISSIGGGASSLSPPPSRNGGSGGGGMDAGAGQPLGGSGTAGQGNNGGNGVTTVGGGGGGSASAGSGQNAGAALSSTITGSSVPRASGGRGGGSFLAGLPGGGGAGGTQAQSTAGGANSGGGGGGSQGASNQQVGKPGGSGVVILRIPTVSYSAITTGSPGVTTNGSFTILQYNSSGTYTSIA